MKRMLVFLSIILLLGSNIAVAMDSICFLSPQEQTITDQDQDQNTDSVHNNCHSSLHFVGIYPDVPYKTLIVRKQYNIVAPFDLTNSQTYQPATPPPNV